MQDERSGEFIHYNEPAVRFGDELRLRVVLLFLCDLILEGRRRGMRRPGSWRNRE